MKALTTKLLTLDMAMKADHDTVLMYTIETTMDPIVPAEYYLGTRPDNQIRWKI